MAISRMKEIANALGVEIGEEFMICDKSGEFEYPYRFLPEGLFHGITEADWRPCIGCIERLAVGDWWIVKQPFRPKDGEEYYYIYTAPDNRICIAKDFWKGTMEECMLRESKLIYRTEKECKQNMVQDYERMTGKEWRET